MKSATLPDFLEFLTGLNAEKFKGDSVSTFLSTHHINQDDFLPFIFFREDTYGRNLVFRSGEFELLVLTWLPNQRTAIHDHSEQRCWMFMTSGELTVRNFHPLSEDLCLPQCCGPVEKLSQGQTVYIDDGVGLHSLANASGKPAVSVHLYAKPITHCRTYNEATKKFERTELFYFTEFGEEMEVLSPRNPTL